MSTLDHETFNDLYEQHAHRIYIRLCKILRDPDLAEDVAQEVWITVWQKPPAERTQMAPWINRVAGNKAIDALRHQAVIARHAAKEQIDELETELVEERPFAIDQGIDSEQLERAFYKLPLRYQRVLLLFLAERTDKAAIEQDGRKYATIKTQLCRARGKLRDYFKEHNR